MTIKSFLQSDESSPHFNGGKSQCVSFSQKLKMYKNETLVNDSHLQNVAGHFLEVKQWIVEYLHL